MTRTEAILILSTFMDNPIFSDEHKAAFNIAIHDIKAFHKWNLNELVLRSKDEPEQAIAELYLKKKILEIIKTIEFEDKWLNDVLKENKYITSQNIKIAMDGIRYEVKKGFKDL